MATNSLDESMGEELSALGMALVTAIFLIFIVMAIQFESPKFSLMVMATIPFSLIGSFGFLFLADCPISMNSMLGFLMLVGTVVNSGILYVDTVNQYRQEMDLETALIEAGATRLRPILMTSLAMVVGLLPLMFAFGVGAHGNRTLGTASIGGMLIGMICQIFIVPALFVIFQYLQEKVKPMEWEDIDNTDAVTEIEQYAK